MPKQNKINPWNWGSGARGWFVTGAMTLLLLLFTSTAPGAETSLRDRLKASAFKIAYECYVHDNWEIFVMNADGSEAVNLTNTPKEHEHFPQVSPDGTKICLSVDQGNRKNDQ
jgi:hypothetical protein